MNKEKIDAEELWNIAWTYIKTVVDTLREPFLILDKDLKILSANRMFYSFFQTTQKNTEGKHVYKIGNGQWNIPQLRVLLEDIVPKNIFFENFTVDHDFPKIGRRIMILNARRIYTSHNKEKPIMLLAIEDITKRVHLENHLKEYTRKLNLEVAKRTAELEVRVKELERKNKIMGNQKKKIASLKLKSKI